VRYDRGQWGEYERVVGHAAEKTRKGFNASIGRERVRPICT
jgi:hypothetical protein